MSAQSQTPVVEKTDTVKTEKIEYGTELYSIESKPFKILKFQDED